MHANTDAASSADNGEVKPTPMDVSESTGAGGADPGAGAGASSGADAGAGAGAVDSTATLAANTGAGLGSGGVGLNMGASAIPPPARRYPLGQRVEVETMHLTGRAQYFAGAISCVNADGTYDITYDDEGSVEKGVQHHLVHPSIADRANPNPNIPGTDSRVSVSSAASVNSAIAAAAAAMGMPPHATSHAASHTVMSSLSASGATPSNADASSRGVSSPQMQAALQQTLPPIPPIPSILGVIGNGFGSHMGQQIQGSHQGQSSHSANARAWQQGPGPALLEQTLQMGMGVGNNGRTLPPSTLQLQLQTALLRQALSQQATHGTQQSLLDVAESSIAKQANLMALHHEMLVREPLPPPVPPPPQHLFQRIQAGLNKGSQAEGTASSTTSSTTTTTNS